MHDDELNAFDPKDDPPRKASTADEEPSVREDKEQAWPEDEPVTEASDMITEDGDGDEDEADDFDDFSDDPDEPGDDYEESEQHDDAHDQDPPQYLSRQEQKLSGSAKQDSPAPSGEPESERKSLGETSRFKTFLKKNILIIPLGLAVLGVVGALFWAKSVGFKISTPLPSFLLKKQNVSTNEDDAARIDIYSDLFREELVDENAEAKARERMEQAARSSSGAYVTDASELEIDPLVIDPILINSSQDTSTADSEASVTSQPARTGKSLGKRTQSAAGLPATPRTATRTSTIDTAALHAAWLAEMHLKDSLRLDSLRQDSLRLAQADVFGTTVASVEMHVADSLYRRAVISGTQTVTSGSLIQLRLLDTLRINGEVIPRNTLLYGEVSIGNSRLNIEVPQVLYHHKSFQVHDFNYLTGLGIDPKTARKGRAINQSQRDQGQRALRDLPVEAIAEVGRNMINALSNNQVEVTLQDGSPIFLSPSN